MAVRDDILATVALMVADPAMDENDIIRRLIESGCSPLRALLLLLIVPLAFGRVVMESMPDLPPSMPDEAAIPDNANNQLLFVRLGNIPEFTESVRAARDGTVPKDQVVKVGLRGSELHAIQAARDAGQYLATSQFSSPFLLGLSTKEAFKEWCGEHQAEADKSATSPPQPQRPWWRFW